MRLKAYINSVEDTNVIFAKISDSVAERMPYATVYFDNTENAAEGDYNEYDDLELRIYIGGADVIVFKGFIEDVDYAYGENRDIKVAGRGYGLLLQEAFVDLVDFTSKTSSYIVDQLRQLYGKDYAGTQVITGTNITTTTDSITRTLKGTTAWEAIMELAIDLEYDAWVDTGKDLHFAPRAWEHSGVTIDSDDYIFSVQRAVAGTQLVNRVIVYGGGSPQVVGQADNFASQSELNLVRTKTVFDTTLTTTAAVNTRAWAELGRYGEQTPEKVVLKGAGWEDATPGTLVTLDLPDYSISGQYYILQKVQEYPSDITTMELQVYENNMHDVILDIIKELRKQRQTDLSSAITSKLLRLSERVQVQPLIYASYRDVGTSFIVGSDGSSTALGYGGSTENEAVAGYAAMGVETIIENEYD